MRTSPDAHNEYITRSHASSGHKFQRVLQLLKYWRECRTPRVPISSFHLELVFAVEGTLNRVATYQELLLDAFNLLRARQCRPIRDPLGVSGTVPACQTDAQLTQAYAAVYYASEKAARAVAFEALGRDADATAAWNLVFNGRFPR
ncbi:MAG: hypothetical protein RLZZ450_866 [Pseudomonadota bacterium]